MAHTYDLTRVPPSRRKETLRRIAALEEFLRNPGRAAAERHAAAIGISPAQFYNLVRAWRDLGRAELIARPGGGRTPGLLNEAQRRLIDETIEQSPGLNNGPLVRAIMDRASREGILMIPRDVLARAVDRRRPRQLPDAITARCNVVIDHTVLEMAVDFGNHAPSRPLATLVIDVRANSIVGVALSDGLPDERAASAAMRDALLSSAGHGAGLSIRPVRLLHAAQTSDAWRGFDAAMSGAGFIVEQEAWGPYQIGQLAEAVLGRSFGWLKLRPRLVYAGPHRRVASWSDDVSAPPPEEALTAVRALIARCPPIQTLSGIDEATRESLVLELGSIVGERFPMLRPA